MFGIQNFSKNKLASWRKSKETANLSGSCQEVVIGYFYNFDRRSLEKTIVS